MLVSIQYVKEVRAMFELLVIAAFSVMAILAVYKYYRGLDRSSQADSDFRNDGHFHLIL